MNIETANIDELMGTARADATEREFFRRGKSYSGWNSAFHAALHNEELARQQYNASKIQWDEQVERLAQYERQLAPLDDRLQTIDALGARNSPEAHALREESDRLRDLIQPLRKTVDSFGPLVEGLGARARARVILRDLAFMLAGQMKLSESFIHLLPEDLRRHAPERIRADAETGARQVAEIEARRAAKERDERERAEKEAALQAERTAMSTLPVDDLATHLFTGQTLVDVRDALSGTGAGRDRGLVALDELLKATPVGAVRRRGVERIILALPSAAGPTSAQIPNIVAFLANPTGQNKVVNLWPSGGYIGSGNPMWLSR
jgi:hypothetical protein